MILALILAAISVTPAYTNVNRAGGSKIMTNIEQWAPAVEAAIGQGGGGGVSTNAVSGIITNHVTSGYLCTIQTAQTKANAAENAAKADAAAKYVPATIGQGGSGLPSYTVNGELHSICAAYFNGLNMLSTRITETSPQAGIRFDISIPGMTNPSDLHPDGTDVLTKGLGDTRYAPISTAVTVANHSSQLTQLSQSIDYTTNNTTLVSTITNLAPSKARGISLSDPVRHCNWYQAVTNGVFYWMVEE